MPPLVQILKLPLGRPPLFKPRRFEKDDLAEVQRLFSEYGSKDVIKQQRAYEVFCMFSEINPQVNGVENLLEYYTGAALRVLRASTTKEYLDGVLTGLRLDSNLTPRVAAFGHRLLRYVKARASEESARSARAIDVTGANALLQRMTDEGTSRATIASCILIVTCGLRARDVARLSTKQIAVNPFFGETILDIKVTKNRRQQIDARTQIVPARMMPEVDVAPLVSFLATCAPQERPFELVTAARINSAMKRCRADNDAAERCHTSYSFRNLFIRRVAEDCERDWEKAKGFTMHRNAASIPAFYVKMADICNRRWHNPPPPVVPVANAPPAPSTGSSSESTVDNSDYASDSISEFSAGPAPPAAHQDH